MMIAKKLRKIMLQTLLMLFTLKKKYILLMFQNITEFVKTSYSFNDSKQKKWHYLAVKKKKKGNNT